MKKNTKTNDYLKEVAVAVAAQGPVTSGEDYLTVMADRVREQIKTTVPSNYRLAVRQAVRKLSKRLTKATAGI